MQEKDVHRERIRDVERAKKGDAAAQERILAAIRDAVYYTCYRMLCDADCAADATESIAQKILADIQTLEDPAAFESRVNQLTAAHCSELLRSVDDRFFAGQDETGREPLAPYHTMDEKPVPQLTVEEDEAIRVMRDAIERLPEEQRICVVLCYFNEMKTHEIAAALHVPERSVRSRLNHARKAMQKSLAPYKKNTALYALAAAPILARTLGLLKTVTAAGGAAIAAGVTFFHNTGNRIAASAVAAVLLGTAGLAIGSRTVRSTEPAAGAEPVQICEVRVEADLYVSHTQIPEDRVEYIEYSAAEQVISEAEPRIPAPKQPVWEAPTMRSDEPTDTPVVETLQASAAEKPHTPAAETPAAPEPEEQEPKILGPRMEPDPEAETPTEEPEAEPTPEDPSEEAHQPVWSEWSTENPPEGAPFRAKCQYRYRIVSDSQSLGSGRGKGLGTEPENGIAWSDWSDEVPEPILSDGARMIVEMRTIYSYCI